MHSDTNEKCCPRSGQSPDKEEWRSRWADRVTCRCGTRTRLYVRTLNWSQPWHTYFAEHVVSPSMAFYEMSH